MDQNLLYIIDDCLIPLKFSTLEDMKNNTFIIASRKSPLALQQTKIIQNRIAALYPELTIEILGMTTQADQMLSVPLTQVGGKGLFVKELEEALLEHRAHLAVHSMKDMPMELPSGLMVPVVCEREDTRDVFVSNHYGSLEDLPSGACVGTSSVRRQSQCRAIRPDLHLNDLRGNVNTRLKRLDAGDFDALILAAAGLKRLGLSHRITAFLSIEQLLPAAGQGALALECRTDDRLTQQRIAPLNHEDTFYCVTAERILCRYLGGNCQVPIAAYAEFKNGSIELRGMVASMDGKTILSARHQAPVAEVQQLGEQVARDLLKQGAAEILKEFPRSEA